MPPACMACPNCDCAQAAAPPKVRRFSLLLLGASLSLGLAACTTLVAVPVYGIPVPNCQPDQSPEKDNCIRRDDTPDSQN